MKTRRVISNVSFNTKDFLVNALNRLIDARYITFWAVAPHKGEPHDDDGTSGKDHFHIFLEPHKALDTFDLSPFFLEPDPEFPEPRNVLLWTPSNFGHWYYYGLHDKYYLAERGKVKQYHYKHSDLFASSQPDLDRMASDLKYSDYVKYGSVLDAIEKGMTFPEFVYFTKPPLNQIAYFSKAYDSLSAAQAILKAKAGEISPEDQADA